MMIHVLYRNIAHIESLKHFVFVFACVVLFVFLYVFVFAIVITRR